MLNKFVAIYSRVSTKDQNPEMQLHQLRGLAERNGWLVYREYVDVGYSGTKQLRPALDQLMTDAARKRFSTFLVWKFDRFARSVSHLVRALEEFNSRGIGFISYTENLDTTSPRISRGQRWGRRPTVDVLRAKELRGTGLSLSQISANLKVSRSAVHRALRA